MNTQPEAMRLADELCAAPERSRTSFEAAAELRRLHQSEREGWRHADELEQERKRLHALNQELVEALKNIVVQYGVVHDIGDMEMQPAIDFAYRAIAKATGETE